MAHLTSHLRSGLDRRRHRTSSGWRPTCCSFLVTSFATLPLMLMLMLLLVALDAPQPALGASNTAGCDWTGSGLSTSRANREVISIYLRCTAGRIVWNYPRGAIRVLLRRPAHLHDNFRACLKIYPEPTSSATRTPKSSSAHQRARIFLEAPRRLIGLFGGGDAGRETADNALDGGGQLGGGGEVLVKCFRSINGQVALYVEAEETPFANAQTVFKYNLEFINNKHYSLRPTDVAMASRLLLTRPTEEQDADQSAFASNRMLQARLSQQRLAPQRTVTATPTPIDLPLLADLENTVDPADWSASVVALWRRLSARMPSTTAASRVLPLAAPAPPATMKRAIDEQIVGRLGETYEICRPCTEAETAHAFCSSELVTRGTMFGVQQRPQLATNEIYVNRTRLLRNNLFDILADQPDNPAATSRSTSSQPLRAPVIRPATANGTSEIASLLSFHTPLHCSTAHEPGEFVFMGRRRFEEMMVICAPRLNEWAATVDRLQRSGEAPCQLSS